MADNFLNLLGLTRFKSKIDELLNGKQDTLTVGDGIKIENDIISGTKVDISKGSTNIIEVEGYNSSKLGFEFSQDDIVLTASSPMVFGESRTLQEKLTAGDNIAIENNTISVDDGIFVAVYEQTSYTDVKAAIDAHKAIVLDMPANNNQFCMTFATYTNGGNALMYAIYKRNDNSTLMTATVTPQNQWTVSHTDLQDKLIAGTNIKTINNTSLLGSGNIAINEVFIAKQGETTASELKAAYAENKVILIVPSGTAHTLWSWVVFGFENNNSTTCELACVFLNGMTLSNGLSIIKFIVNGSNWTFTSQGVQNKLISGTDIKTINNQSLLGSGNIDIGGGTVDTSMSDTSENAVQNKIIKSYVDVAYNNLQTQLGTLTNLTTDDKTNLVNAINEVYEKSGEPFRVKNWASNTLNVEIPTCTEDISNTAIPKMVFSIDNVEGADYQIVGMIAYEVFDAASGGNRINCWPVCQFTGNGQKELSVRWMCGGTTRKTAKRINAWVLLKHR